MAFLLSAGPASSRTLLDVGAVVVEADINRNEGCTLGVDEELCAAVIDANGTSGLGDDEVWHDKSVDEVSLRVDASPTGEHRSVSFRPDELSVEHPVFSMANESWTALDALLPPEVRAHAALESDHVEDGKDDEFDVATWGLGIRAHPLGLESQRVWVLCWDVACGRVWWGYFESEEDGIRFASFVGSQDRWDSDPWLETFVDGFSCSRGVWRGVECPEAALGMLRAGLGPVVLAFENATPQFHTFAHVNGTTVQVGNESSTKLAHQGDSLHHPRNRTPGAALILDRKAWAPASVPSQDHSTPSRGQPSPPVGPSSPPARPPRVAMAGPAVPGAGSPMAVVVAAIAGGVALALVLGFFYTRLGRDRVLEHRTRRMVYEMICKEPGLRVGTIAARLGVDHKTVLHHVTILRDFDLVKTSGDADNRLLPVGRCSPAEEALCVGILANRSARGVYDFLLARGPQDLRSIAAALGLSYSTASAAGVQLRKAGLVERERQWRRWVLRANPSEGPRREGVTGLARIAAVSHKPRR